MTHPNPFKAFCVIDTVYDALFPKLPVMHSHGKAHVMEVVTLLCMLIQQEGIVDHGVITLAIICAVFHEVWDTKIKEGLEHRIAVGEITLKTVIDQFEWGSSLISDCKIELHVMVKAIITRISWRRESEQGRNDWDVLPPLFLQIRHLVSDADKLAAMGPTGILRSTLYQKEHYFERFGKVLNEEEAKRYYWEFSWLERLRYYTEYIRTKSGKAEAERRLYLMHALHTSMGFKE